MKDVSRFIIASSLITFLQVPLNSEADIDVRPGLAEPAGCHMIALKAARLLSNVMLHPSLASGPQCSGL